MADSKEVVPVTDVYSPDFIEELLPCSQQVSKLYHISYLCLAGFPELERILRSRAVETQLLFGDSEALLLKCLGTNITVSCAESNKNKKQVAKNFLEQAERWIKEIVDEVTTMEKRYKKHCEDVGTTTSSIHDTKKKTEKVISDQTEEIERIKKDLMNLKEKQNKVTQDLEEIERNIDAKTLELQEHVKSATATDGRLSTVAATVPFIGLLTKAIYNAANTPAVAAKTKAFETEINKLAAEKTFLKQKEWDMQVQDIEWNMKLAKLKIDSGSIPDPVHLGEVLAFLTKIQDIFWQLKTFWEKIHRMLVALKDQTFVNKDIITDPDLKEIVLMSIEDASKAWVSFGKGCARGSQIFRLQSKDAYSFLEIDPSTLAKDVWQREYDSVMSQLKNLKDAGENQPPAIEVVE